MRDDAMKDRDDLDILLDAALATYADPGLLPGLTSRIVASAHGIDSRRRPVRWLPWAVLALAALVLIVAFFTPHNLTHRTALATLLWLVSSYVLSLYVAKLANFDATYGSIGAVVGIMLWFYVSAYASLLGAELNAQLELAERAERG